MSVCENCGHEVPNDLKHIPDPYDKGTCQTFDFDTSKPRGWTKKRALVNFGKQDAPAK